MLAALALAAAMAATPQQFDLICTGTETVKHYIPELQAQDHARPWTGRVSLDLTNGLYRWGDGNAVRLQDATPTLLTFAFDPTPGNVKNETVDRRSGDLESYVSEPSSTRTVKATCEAAPFRPFPPTKF